MKTLFLILLSFSLSFSSFGARYWVASGPGLWSDPANWATNATNPGGAGVPDAGQTVFFTSNGLGDCTIDIPATAQGFRVEVGYTGTITHTSNSLIIGAQHFYVRDGAINCGSAVVTVAGNLYQYGGNLIASSSSISIIGNLQFFGGTFNHNNGKIEMINVANIAFNVTTTTPLFYDFEMNGGHNTQFTLGAGDTLKVLNNFIGTDGIVRGSPVLVYKNCQLNANFDGGTSPLNFVGSQNGICNFNGGNWVENHWNIEKEATLNTVTFIDEDGDNLLTSGSTLKTLSIKKGILNFENGVVCDLNFSNLNIEANGILKGASKEIVFSGSYTNSGGFFDANSGLFTFDGGSPTFISCPNTANNVFHSVKVNKSHTVSFNIQPGDTLKSTNKTILSNGYVNTGIIAIADTCLVESGFDYGNSVITFVDSGNSTFQFDGGTWPTSNVIISKDNTSDFVLFEDIDGDNSINLGSTNNDLVIRNGEVQFESGILADVDFNSILLQTGGVLTGSDNEVRFSGDYQNTGGTFQHNSGLFRFDAISNNNFVSSVTDLFYDLTIDQDHIITLNIDPASNVHIENNLNLSDGACNLGTLYAEGNVTILPAYDRGSSPLVFTGDKAQAFDLTGSISNYDGNIHFNKSRANTVTLLSPFLFQGTVNTITFTKGYLKTSLTNLFTMADNAVYAGVSDSSFVQGPMTKVGNDAFIFPVGKDSVYAPIRISAPSNSSDQFRAEYFKQSPDPSYSRASKVATIHHISDCEYWLLDRVAGSSNVNVRLSWNTPRSCGVTDLSELVVARWDGSQWVDHGNSATTGNTLSGTVSSFNAVSNFSPFTLGSTTINNPLPIELLNFEAEFVNRRVELKWQTTSEINTNYFDVEKSIDGFNWSFVSMTEGAGNSQTILTYSSFDPSTPNGIAYYRLKQVDFDGKYTYSAVRSILINGVVSNQFLITPNPASDFVCLRSESNSTGMLVVSDAQGKTVMEQGIDSPLTKLDFSTFPKGIYLVKLGDQVEKLILF